MSFSPNSHKPDPCERNFLLKLVAGLGECPAAKQKYAANRNVEQIQHLNLLRFFKNYFVTGSAQFVGQTLFASRPPPFPPTEHHQGTETQNACERFEPISAKIDVHRSHYWTFACDHSKAFLVEIDADRRTF